MCKKSFYSLKVFCRLCIGDLPQWTKGHCLKVQCYPACRHILNAHRWDWRRRCHWQRCSFNGIDDVEDGLEILKLLASLTSFLGSRAPLMLEFKFCSRLTMNVLVPKFQGIFFKKKRGGNKLLLNWNLSPWELFLKIHAPDSTGLHEFDFLNSIKEAQTVVSIRAVSYRWLV